MGARWVAMAKNKVARVSAFVVMALLTAGVAAAAPVFEDVQPADATVTANSTVVLTGTVTGATAMDVDGTPVTLSGSSFTTPSLALSEGTNTFVLTATDGAGGSTQVVHQIERDGTPPAIAVQQPVDGAIVPSSPLTVSGTASDAHLVSVSVAGVQATLDGGAFTASVPLSQGLQTVIVTATDSVGNTSQSSFDVILDTASPTIQMTEGGSALVEGMVFDRAVSPQVTATDEHLATLDLQLDGQGFVSGTPITSEGHHVLAATATDAAGNSATVTRGFDIDTTAPVLISIAPAEGLITADTEVTIAGQVTGAVSVTVDGQAASLAGDSFSAGPLALTEGPRSFSVVATDAAGNSTTATRTIERDATAPTVSVTTPGAGSAVASSPITVTGTATDVNLASVTVEGTVASLAGDSFSVSGIALVEGTNDVTVEATDVAGNMTAVQHAVTLDTTAPSITVTQGGAPLVDGTMFDGPVTPVIVATDASGSLTIVATLDGSPFTSGTAVTSDGAHDLVATATDEAGNASSLAVTFTIDQVAPTIVDLDPPAGTVVNATTVTLSGRAPDAVSVSIDGQPATLTGESWVSGALALPTEGTTTFTLVATDAGGNSTTVNHAIIRDTAAPMLTIGAPLADHVTASTTVTVSGTVSDPRLDRVRVNGTVATFSGGSWLASQVPLGEGANTLTVEAFDAADNRAEQMRSVIRDTTDPVVTVTDPASGTVVPEDRVVLSGTATDLRLDRVEVDGTRATVAGDTWSHEVLLDEGANTFTIEAIDTVGNRATEAASVVRDSQAPAVHITLPNEGTAVQAETIRVEGTVDAEAGITVTVNSVDAVVDTQAGTFVVESVPLAPGTNRLTARATDAQGNAGVHTRDIDRDNTGPQFVTSEPAAGALAIAPTITFRITFDEPLATPSAGSWRVEVAGAEVPSTATVDGDALLVASTGALPSNSMITVVLTSALTDPAGNVLGNPRTLSFTTADVGAPGAPQLDPVPARLCAETVTLSGSAEPDVSLLIAGGAGDASGRANADTGAFAIVVTLEPETLNRLQVTARDAQGNVSPAAMIEVVHDCTAPTVHGATRSGDVITIAFSEPMTASSVPAAIEIRDGATPVSGVVVVAGDGTEATFTADAAMPTMVLLDVAATATDVVGNALAYPFTVLLGAASAGDSFLAGTALDDATGRPLAGVRATVTATDGVAPTISIAMTTGDDGRFLLTVPAGTHDLTLARVGYAPVFRIVTTTTGEGVDVFDGRLTPQGAWAVIDGAGGMLTDPATEGGAGAMLDVQAGALASSIDASVTALEGQALPALLPYGWSPRAGAWVDLDDATLASAAALVLEVDAPDGTALPVVTLDLGTLQWNVVSIETVSAGQVTTAASNTGGWAVVEADTGATAPPGATAGAVLGSAAAPMGGDVTAALITFDPDTVLPTQTSRATVTYTTAAAVPSGAPLTLIVEETLQLLDGSVRQSAPYRADLVLYRDATGAEQSIFRLKPSEAARLLPIEVGVEDVVLVAYGDETVRGNVLGPDGGTVVNDQGDAFDVPAGALTTPTAIVLTRQTVGDLPLATPRGTSLDGVLELDLGGTTLNQPGILAHALDPAPTIGSRGLLLHVIEVAGAPAFRPVAALEATATGWTTATIDPLDLPWPGVRRGGQYAFARFIEDHAFLRGTASDTTGAPLVDGVVSSAAVDWVQLTATDGAYVLPLPLGEATVEVFDPATGNAVTIVVTPDTVDGRIDLDPTVAIVGPYVETMTPADGATGVPLGVEPTIRFSEPVDRASLDGGIQLLDATNGEPVAIEFHHQGSLVTVLPQASLAPSRTYTVAVDAGVLDLQGYVLETPASISFTTQDVAVPETVDATRIFLVAPDGQGNARVRGLTGAAPSGTLVFAENTSQFTATESVLAAADGSFELTIAAALGDALVLHVIIPGANEVILAIGPFMTDDLRAAVVGAEAATFTTVDGLGVTVEAGTFQAPTTVRLTPTSVGPDPLPTPDGFEGILGFDLELGGAQPRRPLVVRLPVTNPSPTDDYILVSSIELLGQRWWTLDDLLRVDGDALTNAPPPDPQSLALPDTGVVAKDLQLEAVATDGTTFAPPITARAVSAEAIWAAKSASRAMTVVSGREATLTEWTSPSPVEAVPAVASVESLGLTKDGSAITTAGVARAARYRVLRAPRVTYFSFSAFDNLGIFNVSDRFMAHVNDSIYEDLRPPLLLLPAVGGTNTSPVVIEGWDISTGYRTFRQVLDPPGVDIEPLPGDVGDDHRAPYPVEGNPVRFVSLVPTAGSVDAVLPKITATFGPVSSGADPTMTVAVTGTAGAAGGGVEIRLVGPRDGVNERARASADGAFTLMTTVRPSNRYILAIGGTIVQSEPLTLRFSESLQDDPTGLELRDAASRPIPVDIDQPTRRDEVTLKPTSGWQAGKTYTLRLTSGLADASGNAFSGPGRPDCDNAGSANTCPPLVLDVELKVAESNVLGTFDLSIGANDMVRQGNLLFVAAGNEGLKVIDASDPANLTEFLPDAIAFPLRDHVVGVAVDGHGRVVMVGGGVTNLGQARIIDVQALGDVDPNDAAWAAGVVAGTVVVSDGPGTGAPSAGLERGQPQSVSLLSSDEEEDWIVGESAPGGLTVTPQVPAGTDPFVLTIAGTDGVEGNPVTLRNLTRGAWRRVDAGAGGAYSVSIQVRRGDRVELSRNRQSFAYVTLHGDSTSDALVIADINSFYREGDGGTTAPGVLTYVGGFSLTTDQAADVFCDGNNSTTEAGDYIDVVVVHDEADTENPWTVLGLARSYGLWLMKPKANDLGDVAFLNGQCGAVGGVARMGGMDVLLDYPMDGQLRDYVVMTNVAGTVLVVDITNRKSISVVSTIPLPGVIAGVIADRANRKLLVSGHGAGMYVVDFDTVSNLPRDADGDGKDDRLLETIELAGESVEGTPLVIPELGLAFAGGTERGLTGVSLGVPVMGLIGTRGEGTEHDGDLFRVRRLAPFGVPTKRDGSGENAIDRPGLVRIEARLPGFAPVAGSSIGLELTGVGPTGVEVRGTGLGSDGPRAKRLVELKRQASNPWEEGHNLFVSEPVVVLADLRASIEVGMSSAERAKEGLCRRCDLVKEGVYATADPPMDQRFDELLSGHFVKISMPQGLRNRLSEIYDGGQIDTAEADAEAESVPWDISPALRQEPVHNAATGTGDVAPGTLLHSGEMTSTAIDLAIAGRGIDVAFARHYRNQTLGRGPLGPGWDHGYRMRLRPLPNDHVDFFDGTGRRETFEAQSDGTFESPEGRFWSLERRAAGWVIIDSSANVYSFDHFGRLVEIADSVRVESNLGNVMGFAYDNDARLSRITDSLDRSIALTYNGEGLLAAVEDYSGREFSYGYDGEGRLTSFKTPEVPVVTTPSVPDATFTDAPVPHALETKYAYVEETGAVAARLRHRDNLATVTDPKGQDWLTLEWSDQDVDGFADEVDAQIWGGDRLTILYEVPMGSGATVFDRRTNACKYVFDGAGHTTRIEDASQAVWTHAYNGDGLVTSSTLPLGGTITNTWASDGSTGRGRDGGNLLSVVRTPDSRGANGAPSALTTSFEYDEKTSQVVRVVDPRGHVTVTERDPTNGLAQNVTRGEGTPDASKSVYTYNDFGQAETIKNPNLHVTKYTYFVTGESRGYLKGTMVDPAGLKLETRYETDARGNVTAVIDARGVRHETAYNVLDWPTVHRAATTPTTVSAGEPGHAPALGYVTLSFFDKNGNLQRQEVPFDTGAQRTTIGYARDILDEVVAVARQIMPGGDEWAVTKTAYDENRNVIQVTDSVGNIRKTEYDARNLPDKLTSGLGTNALASPIEEVPTYNPERALVSFENGRDHTSLTTYDGYGRVMTQSDPLGNRGSTRYDANGNVVCVADSDASGALLAVSSAAYDALDRPTTQTQYLWRYGEASMDASCPSQLPAGIEALVTTTGYDQASNVTSVSDPLGRVSSMVYDGAERLTTMTDPATNKTTLVLDETGNALERRLDEVAPDGTRTIVPTFMRYDALGRQVEVRDAIDNVTKLIVDARGLTRRVVDPTSQFTEYTYDGLNRRTVERKPQGITVTSAYDLASRQLTYQDALGKTTTYAYDAVDRAISVTYPDAKLVTMTYDKAHNRTQWTDQRGTTMVQSYDAANRAISLTATPVADGSLAGPRVETFGWDGLNRRTRMQSGSVVTELAWDSASRLIRDATAGKVMAYQHDSVGNITRTTYPSGETIVRTYDPLNRVKTISGVPTTSSGSVPVEGKSGGLLAEYGYRGPHALQTKTVGGLTMETTFDAARRAVHIQTGAPDAPPVVSERIAWDSRNLKSAIQRDDLGGTGQLMAYDGAHRLEASAKVAQPLTFVAPNSQADSSSVMGQSNHEAFAYDSAMNQTDRFVSKEGVVTSHPTPNDGSGRNRPASVGGMPLVWDDNGNLRQKGDTVMSYDFRNRLTAVERDGEMVAEYTYDALNRRITREADGVTEDYAWDGNQEVETTRDGAVASRRVYGSGIDETVQYSRDSNGDGGLDSSYLTMFDSSNNLAVVTTLAGKPIERYEASAFGERRILVDVTPPAIEQVRAVGDTLWLEVSEGVVGTQLEDAVVVGTLRLHDVVADEDLALSVEQPVTDGGQALRRIVISPDTVPVQGTSLELIIEPGVLIDAFTNTPSATYTLPVNWPSADAILVDTAPPRVGAAIVRDGIVELELSEEVDPASTAITLDGANVAWTLSGDHYTLATAQPLAIGSHTLAVDTAPLDLAGSGLAESFQVTFTVAASDARFAYASPDERETTTSALGNDIGFHGRPVDEASGLMYFRNRWFDPELGRFTTPDPLGFVDGPSQYQFAGYSPANYSDPLGLLIGIPESVPGSPVGKGMVEGFKGAFDSSNPLWSRGLLFLGGVAAVPGAGIEGALNFFHHVDVGTDRASQRIAAAVYGEADPLERTKLVSQAIGDLAFLSTEGLAIGMPGANTAMSPVAQSVGRAVGAVSRAVNPVRWFDDVGDVVADGIRGGARGNIPEVAPVPEQFLYVHHGTSLSRSASIRRQGLDVNRGKLRVDFGQGVYTTTDRSYAAKWASQRFGSEAHVLSFRIPVSELESLNGLVFSGPTHSWTRFVRHHRLAGRRHSFDFVSGPILRNPWLFRKGHSATAVGQQTAWSTEKAVRLLNKGLLP